jgi:hypothetical protein
MLELWTGSLLLVSIWGLLDAGVSVLCGAAVGRYVDSLPRLTAATRMYLLQNLALAVSAAAALVLLAAGVRHGPWFVVGLVLTMGAGSMSTLGALGSSLSVELPLPHTMDRTLGGPALSLHIALGMGAAEDLAEKS